MLKIAPQECLEDFINGSYTERNYRFLLPVYEKLFRDIGEKIEITPEFEEEIERLLSYFSYLKSVKEVENIKFDEELNKKEVVDFFIEKIDKKKLDEALSALEKIICFIAKERKNINGLEIISWSLFEKTSLDEIKNAFIDDTEKNKNIKDSLLSFNFMSLIIEYDSFPEIIINDLLIPVELKNPKRRQGIFDKEVFKLISKEIKKEHSGFAFEDEIKNININYLNNNNNWLITEKTTKKVNIPLPMNSKKIDMICKLNKSLFIGTHKEQQGSGGAQDNQAVDASFLFNYKENELLYIKEMFDVNEVYLCIILERGREKITSNHWKKIFEKIENSKNQNKYLLSSVQFIDLIKSEI